jgi:hypothetical protein
VTQQSQHVRTPVAELDQRRDTCLGDAPERDAGQHVVELRSRFHVHDESQRDAPGDRAAGEDEALRRELFAATQGGQDHAVHERARRIVRHGKARIRAIDLDQEFHVRLRVFFDGAAESRAMLRPGRRDAPCERASC